MSCCRDKKTKVIKTEEEALASNTHAEKKVVPKLVCQKNCKRCRNKHESLVEALIKKIVPVLVLLFLQLLPVRVQAQDTLASAGFWDDPFNHPLFPLYVISVLIFITIVLALVVAVIMLRVLRTITQQAVEARARKLGVAPVPMSNWWTRFWDRANVLVPLEEEKSIELAHNYDGIRELDNHLPPWWKGLFYGSIVFSVVYMAVYHVFDALPLPEQEYENELAQANVDALMLKASQPVELIDESTLVFNDDAEIITKGRIIFMSSNCASCHRPDGGGNSIGPNLTDSYWLHGGELKHVFATIKNGVVEKAMPAWGKVMSQRDVRNLAFYIMSLHGSHPVNAKAPQGSLYIPVNDSKRSDSLTTQVMRVNQ